MNNLKSFLPRLGLWILFVCLPASILLSKLDSPPPKVGIPEISNLEGAVPLEKLAEVTPPSKEVSTKIAGVESEAHSKNDSKSSIDSEKLISMLSRSQAQQITAIRVQSEESSSLKRQLAEQKEKMDTMLEISRQQTEQIKILIQKVNDTEKRVGDKPQQDQLNVEKIMKMYSSMTPENVARITQDMEIDPLAKIFSQMKDKDLAKIMQALPAKRAAALTLKMGNLGRSVK